MPVTTSNSIPGTVFIQDKHLAWAKPSLHSANTHRDCITAYRLIKTAHCHKCIVWWRYNGQRLTKQQKVSQSLWSNVSRCTISKSEAWSKLQGLAEINSSMPCFWALSASIQPTAQGKEHGSEEKTSVRHRQTASLRHNTETLGIFFLLLLRANYKHLQLTLSTCIVSDSVKRFDVLVDEILLIFCCMCMHAS